MATHSHSARPWAFKLTGALVVAACAVAVPTIILASQPARPAAPFGVHLTEAEFAAAKCYALRAQIEARTDPRAVSAWAQKYNVDAETCRGILAKSVERRPMMGNMHAIDTDHAQG
jgi:hypothetical protein